MRTVYVIFKTTGGIVHYKEEALTASLNQITAERELQELAEMCAESLRRQGCRGATVMVIPAHGSEPLSATIVGIPGAVGFLMREIPLVS